MTRQRANRELLEHLILLVEKHPDQRFGQLLQNAGFLDALDFGAYVPGWGGPAWKNEFYLEPQELLKRVQETLKQRSNNG